MTEVWKPILGYEGYYDVSNTGKVRSLDRKRNNVRYSRNLKGKELKQSFGNSGYLQVNLSVFGKQKIFMVHRLVGIAFVENDDIEFKIAINHKDGNKTNNNASNLEWVSYSENQKHAYENGLNKWNPSKGKPMKSVVQIDPDTDEVVCVFDSIGDATRRVGAKSASGISHCCNHKKRYNTAYGFKWMFEKEYEDLLESEE